MPYVFAVLVAVAALLAAIFNVRTLMAGPHSPIIAMTVAGEVLLFVLLLLFTFSHRLHQCHLDEEPEGVT